MVQDVVEKGWLVHDVGSRDCTRGGSTRCRRQRLYQQRGIVVGGQAALELYRQSRSRPGTAVRRHLDLKVF